jgi:hypothetical protein
VKIKQLGEISWKNFLGGGNFRFFGKFCTSASSYLIEKFLCDFSIKEYKRYVYVG